MFSVLKKTPHAVAALPSNPLQITQLSRISRAVLSEDMNTCFDYTTGGRAAPQLFVIKLNSQSNIYLPGSARSLCESATTFCCARGDARGVNQ